MNIKNIIHRNNQLNEKLKSDFYIIHDEIKNNWPLLKFLIHDIFVSYSGIFYSNRPKKEYAVKKINGNYFWAPVIISTGIPKYINIWIGILLKLIGKRGRRVILSENQFNSICIKYDQLSKRLLDFEIILPAFETILSNDIYVYNRVFFRPLLFFGGSAAKLNVASALFNHEPLLSIGFNHHNKPKNSLDEPVFSVIENHGYKYYLDYVEAYKLIYANNGFRIQSYENYQLFYIPTSLGHYQYGPYQNLNEKEYLDWQLFLLNYLKKFKLTITVIKHPKGKNVNYSEHISGINETVGLNGTLPGGNSIVVIDYVSSVLSQFIENGLKYVFIDLHTRNPTMKYLSIIKKGGDYIDLLKTPEDLTELDEIINSKIHDKF